MTTLREFIEKISAGADALFQATGRITPTYFIVEAGDIVGIAAPPVSKSLGVELMRHLFKKLDTKRYCYVDEAWLLVSPKTVDIKTIDDAKAWRESQPQPSDHPDRIEVVMFFAEDEAEGFYGARRMIETDADGKRTLGPLSGAESNPSMVMGQMTGLLPAKGTRQ
jgi:hypothetical protein